MADPTFGFQQQVDPALLQKLANSGNNSGWGPVVEKLTGAFQQFQQGQQQKQKQAQLVQLLQQMRGTPQGGQTPTQIPPGQPMTAGLNNVGQDVTMTNPQQQPPQAGGMDKNSVLKAYANIDPQGAQQLLQKLMSSQMGINPQKPTSPWRVVPGELSKNGKPIQQNEQTGEVREASLDVGLQPNARVNASQARTDFYNKALDYRQRDLLAKGTNLPGVQLKTLTQNNMRADRAIDLLSAPQVTWQKLNFAVTDLGAIMQGGVPHKEEILNAQFPSWKQKVAQYKTFATGQPDANVPEPIKNEVLSMIQSLKKVDNDYLTQNMNNQMDMIGPTVKGFDQIKPMIQKQTNTFMQGTNKSKSGTYSDPEKEARYQAWKKSQGL